MKKIFGYVGHWIKFFHPGLSPHVIFKGGTSLSKCYKIIERFSEDIDLTLCKKYIGIHEENDPANETTKKQQDKRLKELSQKVKTKINGEIRDWLIASFSEDLAPYFQTSAWQLAQEENDEQSLIFHYPSCFPKRTGEYIQSAVKLEFGARGDISPFELRTINPYCQQLIPELYENTSEIIVPTLLAKRTWWEKVTLLHAEYYRSPEKSIPHRLFRHYYDVYMLDKNNLTEEALKDVQLLEDVVRNKSIYFPSGWANYEEAKIGTLHLHPNQILKGKLKQDHNRMSDMFFGNLPDFDDVMNTIEQIENRINNK